MEKKELPLLSFAMPVFGDEETVAEAIQSIIDQDYPNIEVIVCVDGCKKSEKAVRDFLASYKGKKRVEAIYLKKNQGACVARNTAAKEAKGKYISFLPADAFLRPGAARTWINYLERNPQYDFLYGGYRFMDKVVTEDKIKEFAKQNKISVDEYVKRTGVRKNTDGNYVVQEGFDYISRSFDPYILETSNYIDGSFPLKTEMFWKAGGWDPKIKSLQDWDLWLGVVKAGGKGMYVRDIYFDTHFPHEGGLSHDSAKNWLERTTQIKKKHGIPERKICVASLGAPFHGQRVAKLIDADYSDMPSFKPHRYEMVYLIGFYPSIADQCGQVFANCRGKRVIHWIGTDIWQMQQMPLMHRNILLDFFKKNIDYHLCEAEFTQKELKELGIDAKVVPLPPFSFPEMNPLPEKFTVGVYAPANNAGFYLPDLCKQIAQLCPEITFKFFGNPQAIGVDEKIQNIQYVGYVDKMQEFINDCSALLRLTVHDGLPISALEFLIAGRNLVTNVPVKHARFTRSGDPREIADILKSLVKEPLNKKASTYWKKELDHKKYKDTLYDLATYKPEEYWEQRAEDWHEMAKRNYSLPQEDKESIEKMLKTIDYKSVLDIGMGDGRFVPMFEGKKYLGVDISKKLTKIAQKRFPEHEFKTMKVEDIEKLPGKFDLIFSYTTLEHIKPEDWESAVKALKKKGKKLLLIEPMGFESLNYCIDHNYDKAFKVLKKRQLSDKWMYLCEL